MHLLVTAGHASPPNVSPEANPVVAVSSGDVSTNAQLAPVAAVAAAPVVAPPDGVQAGTNSNAANDVESRTLRWLMLWLMATCNRRNSARTDALLTLRVRRLAPIHAGCLQGTLQVCASVFFVAATVIAFVWALLTVPLALLSMAYPIIQPVVYLATRREDDVDPPVLAPVLSGCCAVCLFALLPLRLSRRASMRISLQNALQALPCRFAEAMRVNLQRRCDVAVATASVMAAAETEGLAERRSSAITSSTLSAAATSSMASSAASPPLGMRWARSAACWSRGPSHTPHAPKVRFDDDCFLCLRKVESRRGICLFLDAVFLGPQACTGSATPLPHLPEPIRQRIYAFTRSAATDAPTTLECGHRFHQLCHERDAAWRAVEVRRPYLNLRRSQAASLGAEERGWQCTPAGRRFLVECPECNVMWRLHQAALLAQQAQLQPRQVAGGPLTDVDDDGSDETV